MANALSNQMFDKELEASPLILIFSGFDHAPVILKTFPTQWIPKELPQWCFRFVKLLDVACKPRMPFFDDQTIANHHD